MTKEELMNTEALLRERDEFERWALREYALDYLPERFASGRYKRVELQRDWETWQARAALAHPPQEPKDDAYWDGLTHERMVDLLRQRGDSLSLEVANSLVYFLAQDGLIEKAQAAAERAHAELAETKRPLDEQMARLNQKVIELTAENDRKEADARRYRFWRKFYRSDFAISGKHQLKFMPNRPQVEIAGPEYEKVVDAALDAAISQEPR